MRTQVNEIVYHVQARETGATITVERTGDGSWLEQESGWMTLCLNHSTCCFHETKRLAKSHSSVPSGWCEDCRRITDGSSPRITGRKIF